MKKLSRNIFFEPVAVENKWHGADWSNFQLVELQKNLESYRTA